MKKKLSSILALSMALALTFGMTVSAEGSKGTSDQTDTTDTATKLEEEVKVDGVTIDVAADDLSAAEAATIQAAAEKEQTVSGKTYVKKAGATTITMDIFAFINGDENQEVKVPAGTSVKITVIDDRFKANTTYLVYHEKNDGTTEAQIASTNANKAITITLSGLSPVAFVEVEEKAGATTTTPTTTTTTTTTTDPAASPKTGETLPVAGIAMVIALAGLAVGAKKVRVNR